MNAIAPHTDEILQTLKDFLERFPQFQFYPILLMGKMQLNINLATNDFILYCIVNRGALARFAAGNMYSLKCLDKKRIKLKCRETLALNERILLTLVSTGEGYPFTVLETYEFQTPVHLFHFRSDK